MEGGAPTPELDAQARVAALADEAALEVGVYVLRVRVRQGSRGKASVVVTVDREGGVDLDVIAAMSQALSARLDREDPVVGSYVLEVESPGERRPLRLPDDVARFAGEAVEFTVVEAGRARRLRGDLLGAEDDGVRVRVEGAQAPEVFPIGSVEEMRLAKPKVADLPRKPGAGRRGSKGRHA